MSDRQNQVSTTAADNPQPEKKFPNEEYYEVVLREPEAILKRVLGPGIEIVSFQSSQFIKTGENYGSTILKVKLIYRARAARENGSGAKTSPDRRRENDEREREVNLVAKMSPPTEFQRQMFQSSYSFRKEIFVYDDMLPFYKKIYEDHGLDRPFGKFDLAPKFFGARLSLDPDDPEKFDDDAVILMENLKYKDYFMASRFDGLDLEYMQRTIEAAVKFHGMGLIISHRKLPYTAIWEKYVKPLILEKNDMFEQGMFAAIKKVDTVPEFAGCKARIEALYQLGEEKGFWYQIDEELPWSCPIHGDLWSNNVLYHLDDEGKIDDVKFVDFQTYYLNSPLRDLIFLIVSSLKPELLRKHFRELVELYRTQLEATMREAGCDVGFLEKQRFEARLKTDLTKEFFHLFFMFKVITMNENESFETTEVNDFYWTRIEAFLRLFNDNGYWP